ncbi:thiol-disulfide oxidoreductase DCC family protein [Chitinophaga nivalis]|uniref:Thiol-disulfide oxidoreductase DCC family protein n=1 Tax=Chitinophaga nivalis TaxID=2991709 RepID=A0ABT3IL72_9BACT|nr:thiol-disulfide oxidoreductase DCC family protein [Chitinophaga nivalis]MCW3465606.1 thiol-disulfide oxidoreductase DCC family protein [Chitinophaga nivalis]MCW3484703.1 thiol-disulfide oxidoreductase DCC family protein [Chitinophaga nivalis]
MENGIILFDGVCNFCNASINFVIRHDRQRYFRFAPLQSDTAAALAGTYHFDPTAMASFILIENGRAYTKSTAALRVARRLPWPWKLGYAGIIIPPFIRHGLYSWIARNRYRWFGRQESCMMPTPEVRSRFLT